MQTADVPSRYSFLGETEVALQLLDIYAGALRAGASAAEAEARLRDEIHDWRALARDLQLAKQPLLAVPRSVTVRCRGHQLAASLLFGVTPGHPLVLASVLALVLTVAIAACLEPAARATRTSFVSALR